MTGRERVLAAIRHEVPDRVPVDAICVENMPEIAACLGIAVEDVLDRLGLDGRIASAVYAGAVPPDGQTEWGTSAFYDYGTAHTYPLVGASVREIEAYAWPDPAQYDYAGAAAAAEGWHPSYAVRGPGWRPLFCQVSGLVGIENALMQMLEAPAAFEALLDHVLEVNLAYCERFVEACGDTLDIFLYGDDFATQRGLMMEPEMWRRFLKPRYERLFAIGKRAGKPVWLHSCGDVTTVLPDLIDIGVDVWETVQLHTLPMPATGLKRQYGAHLAFFGGVNTQRLPFAGPEVVGEEVARCIECLGEGGGYICGPDHHIKPDVSPEATVALFDAARGFRREGYTRAG